jgi:hypothetical protein
VFQSNNDGVGAGAWVSTGSRQFAQTTNHFQNDSQGNYIGTIKLRVSLSVNGSQMSGNAEAILSDPTGAVQQDLTGITLTATQITVETISSM